MDDRFAFILPVMQVAFGVAAVLAGRWRVSSAGWWAGGFLASAAGFAMPALGFLLPIEARAILASAVFSVAFFCFGQALCEHFGLRRSQVALRLGLALAASAGSAWGVAIDSLRLHLVASDIGCALLLAVPLLAARGRIRRSGDRALVAVSWVVVADCSLRALAIRWLAAGGIAAFPGTAYAFYYQVTGSLIGVAFAMAALASVMIGVLMRYRDWAICDPLTGLLNRRGFDEALAGRSPHERAAAAVIVCDIDHFKAVNDRFGHHRGDEVIAQMAAAIDAQLPARAFAARFGGEEFVIYLPQGAWGGALANALGANALGTNPLGANALGNGAGTAGADLAEAVRRDFAARAQRVLGRDTAVTASFGISAVAPGEAVLEAALRRADQALYQAKSAGRNCCVVRPALFGAPAIALRQGSDSHHPTGLDSAPASA
jgi:GGDEF domain-containing protein